MQQKTDNAEPVVIKKYANRRLYNTDSSIYVTLEDLADMVKAGQDFLVFDAKTGEDITRSVLTQIIFEQEGKGQNLLPIRFLRQLIRFYDDSMQQMVPSYLEFSMDSLTKDQDRWRKQMTETWGAHAMEAVKDQVERNISMFEQAMSMFVPFTGDTKQAKQAKDAGSKPQAAKSQPEAGANDDLSAMKDQIADMQSRLEALARKRS